MSYDGRVMSVYVTENVTLRGVTPQRGKGALGTAIACKEDTNRDPEPIEVGKWSLRLSVKQTIRTRGGTMGSDQAILLNKHDKRAEIGIEMGQ